MRPTLLGLLIALPLLEGVSFGQRKDCEELKKEIAEKLDTKGVKNYALTVTDAKQIKDTDKVVGSCDGGTKKIVYTRG